MKQHSIHYKMIREVAERLGPMRQKIVFGRHYQPD